jgi:hypothetical protein
MHDKFLRDHASHGCIVSALVHSWLQRPRNDPARQEKDYTDVARISQTVTWAAWGVKAGKKRLCSITETESPA